MVRWIGGIELFCALPGTKEQQLVPDQWTACGKAILILPQNATLLAGTL